MRAGPFRVFYADPDGEVLAYDATSSDPAAAAVAVSADTLAVTGVSVGTATVTVTATDPGGLSAAVQDEGSGEGEPAAESWTSCRNSFSKHRRA